MFVFLDLFDNEGTSFSGFGLHPHSGITTLTYLLEGSVRYQDTTGATGILPQGGVEWFKAGLGAWHGDSPGESEQHGSGSDPANVPWGQIDALGLPEFVFWRQGDPELKTACPAGKLGAVSSPLGLLFRSDFGIFVNRGRGVTLATVRRQGSGHAHAPSGGRPR